MINDVLKPGAENGIKAVDLMLVFGVSDRDLRHMIDNERKLGFPILSGMNGYYLPSDGQKGIDEMERHIHTQKERAIHTFSVISTMNKHLSRLKKQQEQAPLFVSENEVLKNEEQKSKT